MADPLSMSLAAITLATALKDLVELGQQIYESFKKPTFNMRAAELLAAETLEITNNLKEFYDRHTEILNNAPDMRDAVLRLLQEMNVVYQKCKPIIQNSITFKSKLQRVKHIISAWKNGKILEVYIRNLRDRASKCYIQFMMFAVMRVEATAIQIRGAVADGFAREHRIPPSLRVTNDNILAFVGSTPVVLSTLPPHVQLSEDLIFRSYVSLQTRKIDAMIKHLASTGSYSIVEEPDALHIRPFKPKIALMFREQEEIEYVQNNVLVLITNIQGHLRTGEDRPSVQKGAWAMSILTIWLLQLAMYEESLTISLCVVELYRTLIKTNPDIYTPHLVNALYLLSISFVEAGDIAPAHKFIIEGVALGRRFAETTSSLQAQFQTATLITFSGTIARLIGDSTSATQHAKEAIRTFERLNANNSSVQNEEVGTSENQLKRIVMAYEATNICYIADAFAELHYNLSLTAHKEESVEAGVKALQLYNVLDEQFNNPKIHDWIAGVCLSLASNDFGSTISPTQALLYAQRSVKYYEMTLKNTGVFPKTMPVALTTEAEILSRLGRFSEAYLVCQKTIKMVQDSVEDRRLRAHSLHLVVRNLVHSNHHAEAATLAQNLLAISRLQLSQSEIAVTQSYLSVSFTSIGNFPKAIEAAEASAIQCRALAHQAKQYTSWVANSLLQLAYILSCEKDHDRAFKEGGEGLELCSSLIKDGPSFLTQYQRGLEINMSICMAAKMETKSLERSLDVIQRSRELVKTFPHLQEFLFHRILEYATLLRELGHLSEASASIEEVLSWFEVSAQRLQDADSAALHTSCLLCYATILFGQGSLHAASGIYNKAIKIGQPFNSDLSVSSNILGAKVGKAFTLYNLGQTLLALPEIEDCIKRCKDESLKNPTPTFFWCLDVASLIYRSSGRVDDGLSTIRLSVGQNRSDTQALSSCILSDLLADVGQTAEALRIAEKVSEETRKEATCSMRQERQYKEAQYTLALRLFANGDLPRARKLIVDVRHFYSRCAKARGILFINLAISLMAEGVLECASNRHEGGIVARAKLDDLQKHLRNACPSLADLVQVRLKREQSFAAWRNILEKYRPACAHQNEKCST